MCIHNYNITDLFSVPDPTVGKIVVSGILDRETNGINVVVFYVTAIDSAGHNDTVIYLLHIIIIIYNI